MRPLLLSLLLPIVILCAACQGTQPYSSQDVAQVHQAWREIRPVYFAFRRAYFANDLPGMMAAFKQNEHICDTVVDAIDARDTIDPNVQLFEASAALDNICDTIETGYATWNHLHHRPYDKTIGLSSPATVFLGEDLEVKRIPGFLKHPSALS